MNRAEAIDSLNAYLSRMGSDCDHSHDECPPDCPRVAYTAEAGLAALIAEIERLTGERDEARASLALAMRAGKPSKPPRPEGSGDPLTDLVQAVDRLEREPHMKFVSLKWLRDTYLPKRGFAWANDADIPYRLIGQAVAQEILLVHHEPNPKAPQFPTACVRVNRGSARVREMLGASAEVAP